MKKRKYYGKKRIDINQKSFAFTHRYDEGKFAFEKLRNIKDVFNLKINNRLILSSIIFSTIFVAIAIKMVEINLFYQPQDNYFSSAEYSERGNFYDRNNISLTANLRMYDIGIKPNKIHEKNKFVKKFASLYDDITSDELSKRIDSNRFFYLKRQISPQELQKIIDLGETGVVIQDSYKRIYSQRELFSHLIGKVDIDNKGVSGMEKSFNIILFDEEKGDVISSVDTRLQHIIRDELLDAIDLYSATGGAGLIIDINNGEILSMVSLPDFDPNLKIINNHNMFNKNTLGLYEFGSVMKTFTTAIGIEEKKFSTETLYDVPDSIKIGKNRVKDVHRPCEEDRCSVEDIFVHSSNVGTVKMIRDIGTDLQKNYLDELGLFYKVNIKLPELASPLLPETWRMVNTESISYGYGLSISPLHLAYATATVLNGGYILEPSIIKKDVEQDYGRKIFSDETSEIMRYLFSKVVSDGTAQRAFSEHTEFKYIVGGKTGTAKKIEGKQYANKKMTSFISAFPINRPKYLILVSLDEPKGINDDYHPYNTFGWTDAGWNAARVSRNVIDRISPILDTNSRYLPSENLIIKTSLQ